jgi:REP element-mobilizing transposase RayT
VAEVAHPVHVVLKVLKDVPRLRRGKVYAGLKKAFSKASRETFRLVQYSVQGNHLHLIVEAEDKVALSRGMQGLAIRAARAINRAVGRRGKVFFDRYFPRTMTFPQQMRRGLVYVLNNYLHHGDGEPVHGPIDPFSSAAHFDGWRYDLPPNIRRGDRVCPPPRTWLLTTGWLRHGKLRFTERPT